MIWYKIRIDGSNKTYKSFQLIALSSFIIALTESLFVYLSNRIASALEHLPYSITILIFSGESPSSDKSSADGSSTFGAYLA